MTDIVQIVRDEIVANIDNTVRVKFPVTDDQTTITVRLCDNKWLRINRFAYDSDLAPLQVVEFIKNPDGSIDVKFFTGGGISLKRGDILTIDKPIFQQGTVKTANNEWKLRNQEDDRQGLPLIWMSASTPENEPIFDSPVSFEAMPRIFFLDQIDMIDSLDDQMRDQAVRPMLALEEAFNEYIEESYKVDRINSGARKTLSIFGNEDKDGFYEMIFDAELGGVEARPTLKVYKSVACKC